jgi:hypothetical protein
MGCRLHLRAPWQVHEIFAKLAAWRRANELQMLCEELLQSARVKRDFKYFDQLSDASGSAPRNIPKTEPVKSKCRDPEP